MSAPFRCAASSLLRNDPIAGTASTVRAFLLVENPGPWGADALRDNRMPQEVKTALERAAGAARVRVLLIRRYHRRAPRHGFRVFAAYADPQAPWMESTVLEDATGLLDLDLPALGRGRSPGLTPYPGHLLCVCTHGRHDACCAEKGRPVAEALSMAHPEETWEVSHIGGDRFAGNLLVLPHGLYYGRLDPQSALTVAGGMVTGQLELDHLRGRSGHAMPVQAAEVALRMDLAETRDDAVRLVSRQVTGDLTEAVFDVAGATYAVLVRTSLGVARHQLTCRALRDDRVPQHEVLGINARHR